jgi:xylulose-5-phosphate/fructose-6-phosphate phosphoketolase
MRRFRTECPALDRTNAFGDSRERTAPAKGNCIPRKAPPSHGARVKHKHYIDEHGEDLPEIRNWRWGAPQ